MERHLSYAGADQNIFSDRIIDQIFRYSSDSDHLVNKDCPHSLLYGSQNGTSVQLFEAIIGILGEDNEVFIIEF